MCFMHIEHHVTSFPILIAVWQRPFNKKSNIHLILSKVSAKLAKLQDFVQTIIVPGSP